MVSTSKYFVIFLFGLCVNFGEVFGYETRNCWSQACRECPSHKEQLLGEQVQCDLTRTVAVDWLSNQRPQIPINFGSNLVDFACIKMVATDTKTSDESTDILRGCVIAQTAQSICDGLVGMELSRGKADARCHVCTGDYCNSSATIASSLLLMLVSFIISRIISN